VTVYAVEYYYKLKQ